MPVLDKSVCFAPIRELPLITAKRPEPPWAATGIHL